MDNFNPYEKLRKSKKELYQEKLQKINETQDWIFGNSFGKPGCGAPLRDNRGNVISSLKSITEDNIYKYDPNSFSKGNNDISVINHRVINNSNYNQIYSNNTLINDNIINYNNQPQNNNNFSRSYDKISNYNIKQLKNNTNINENQKENNLIIKNNNIGNISYMNSPNFNLSNSPYILLLPQPFINLNSLSTNTLYNNSQLLNNIYSQQYKNNNNNNYIYNQNINNINNNQNISSSYFGTDAKKRDEQKFLEKQEYRNELLLQIEEKKRKDEEAKRKMEEEDKIQEMNNEEYYRLKQLQAEEQARKLRERINRRMQRSYEDYGSSSNIQEISKDFEKVNKSNQGESPLNNNFEEQKNNEGENSLNIEDNIFGVNMMIEQENYLKKIDDDFQTLRESLNFDIDKQINNTINNNNIINKNIINNNNNDIHKSQLFKKENQLADYILGTSISPPTPIKTNVYNSNVLSHSYSQKRRIPLKDYPNISNMQNDKDIEDFNIYKSKTFNLEDFFNKDEKKKDNTINIKESIKAKEAQDKVEKDFESIFKDLKKAHEYTKKYSEPDEDDSLDNTTSSFISKNTNKKTNYKNPLQYNTKYNASYYLNSSATFTNYDRSEKKKKKEINKDKISDNEMVDENSGRSTGIKNVSKTVLDKVLLNIQENKEDEEDEEDDEQNQKNKQDKNVENNENQEKHDNNAEEIQNDIKNEEEEEKDNNENVENDDINNEHIEEEDEENEEEENVEEQ